MFDVVPTRIWLLLLIAIIAIAPARYVLMHAAHASSQRDITQPTEDLSWRSSRALSVNLAILAGLAALAIFIFTPAAIDVARSGYLMPALLAGVGGFGLWSVFKGLTTGAIEPMVRGASWMFRRVEHPKRYWASMAWNGLIGMACLGGSGFWLGEVPQQNLRDRCRNWNDAWRPAQALAACNRLLTEHGDRNRADTMAARGSAYYGLRDYRRAGADYATAIRLDPQDSSSHYNLGLVYERLNDRTRAAAYYGAALRIDPRNKDAYLNRGLIFLDTNRLDDAIADFTRAHELEPADVMPLANRGVTYAWKDDTDRAERDFAAVRKTEPDNRIVRHGESILAFRSGDYDRAIQLLSGVIERHPNDAWALEMRASAYGRLNAHEKARADRAAAQRLRDARDRR